MKFEPEACPVDTKWAGGYAGGQGMDVHKVADAALGRSVTRAVISAALGLRAAQPVPRAT